MGLSLASFKSVTTNLLCEEDGPFHFKQNEGFLTLEIREGLLIFMENVEGI